MHGYFSRSHMRFFSYPISTSVLDSLEWAPRSHRDFAFLPELHYRHVPKTTLKDEYILDANKSNKKTDNLFEATITSAKATNYEKDITILDIKRDIDTITPTEILEYLAAAELFYPIVVFDGKMFLAEKTEEYGEMNLTPIDHVCLFFNYISGSYDIDLYIDIVQREAFEKFFSSVVKDIKILRKALATEVGIKFRQEVIKALRWYSSKKSATYQPTL